MRSVQFKNRSIDMAGNLYLPNGFKESQRYPAIVCVHPGGGVKEQTVGVYAQRLARDSSPSRTTPPIRGRAEEHRTSSTSR
jgi:uncharacterized protein